MTDTLPQPETPSGDLISILKEALTQSADRKCGSQIHFSFKDPNCNISKEAYRGWTLFVSGTQAGEVQCLRLRNDAGIDKTFSGSREEILDALNIDKDIPDTEQIITGISENFKLRRKEYERWKAQQTQPTVDAVIKATD